MRGVRRHIQLRIRLQNKSKPSNYLRVIVVYVADTWSEKLCSYLGRSHQRMELMHMKSVVTTNDENVSRQSAIVFGHCTIVVANMMGRTELWNEKRNITTKVKIAPYLFLIIVVFGRV